ncbi:MAG: LamG domain-containing protein, partial [Planctomycetes bacterium]|nr:LamG domain-containing protein [Planctomycetota bacterium]
MSVFGVMVPGSTRNPGKRRVAGPLLRALSLMLVAALPRCADTSEFAPASNVNPDPNIFETALRADEAMRVLTRSRPLAGLQALYTFQKGSGLTVFDVSGVAPAMNLTIEDVDRVTWLQGGGLSIDAPTIVETFAPADKIIQACMSTDELSIEAWIVPANITQDGPARIVALTGNPIDPSNFMVGQGLWGSQPSDLITARCPLNDHLKATNTPPGSLAGGLTHVVFTRQFSTNTNRVYINGNLVASSERLGDFSDWDPTYHLNVANDQTRDRPWLGVFKLIAIYSRPLTEEEVAENFDAGPDAGGVVPSEISIDKTPDFQAVIGGTDASFSLIVQNPGNSDLSNVIVTDPECDTPVTFMGLDDGDMILQPGETWIDTCTVNNVTADFTNTADVLAD